MAFMAKPTSEKSWKSQLEALLKKHLASEGPGFKLLRFDAESGAVKASIDFVARLEAPPPPAATRQKAVLLIEVKSRGEPSFLAQAISNLKAVKTTNVASRYAGVKPNWVGLVVAAPFISDRGRKLLKDADVGYMDLAGNCYFTLGAFTIDRAGRQNPVTEKRVARSLFAPKGTRVVRALLEEPKRAWTLSELSHVTNLSLGYVHAVIRKMEEQLWASRNEEYRVVLDKPAELLDAWAKAHDITTVETHAYYSFQRNLNLLMKKFGEASDSLKADYALTLHAGASLVAPFTRFAEVHVYVEKADLDKWAKALNLRPSETGANVHLLVAPDAGVLYRRQTINRLTVVCKAQLYVDLFNYPARGREQAEFLRKEKMGY